MDVGHFWAFQADESSLEKQRHLTAEINKRTLNPVSVSLYPNLLCLAPYSETREQSFYYRAKILHLRGNRVEVNVLVNMKLPNSSYVELNPDRCPCNRALATDVVYSGLNCKTLHTTKNLTVVSPSGSQVFFIDFGNTAFVACCSLRELPSDLLSQPFQVAIAWEAPLAWMMARILKH